MKTAFAIYKGLQKPLVYRGFKGKFIAWGIASLAGGLLLGGVSGALINMYFGGFLTLISIAAGLAYTFSRQKNGLHDKTKNKGIYVFAANLKKLYERSKKTDF